MSEREERGRDELLRRNEENLDLSPLKPPVDVGWWRERGESVRRAVERERERGRGREGDRERE